MNERIPEPTPYDLVDHDLGEIRAFLTNASDILHDIELAKECLQDHLAEIAEHDRECYAPFKSLVETGAFEKLKILLNSIELEIIECENRVHDKQTSNDESHVPRKSC